MKNVVNEQSINTMTSRSERSLAMIVIKCCVCEYQETN